MTALAKTKKQEKQAAEEGEASLSVLAELNKSLFSMDDFDTVEFNGQSEAEKARAAAIKRDVM